MVETRKEAALFVVHYHEIALKGRNRRHFEQLLAQRLRDALGREAVVRLLHGRILIEVPADREEEARERLARVFGVAYFARVWRAPVDMEAIAGLALALLAGHQGSFRVSARRANKRLPFTSPEAEREIGARIVAATGWPVRLKGADAEVFVEFYENEAWVYTSRQRTPGPGGLPVGASGKVVVLASGGIDSPVAAWRMAKRGARPVYVHFHSYPHTSLDSLRKTEAEIEVLARWHGPARLYVVPLAGVQEEVFAHSPERYRTLLYRRFMYRIAERIAAGEKAGALVSGDALGQVASQTLENMNAVQAAVKMLVLRPLVGMDKTEVIAEAQRIGTYEISILPQQDCCSFLEPKRPATRSTPEQLERAEARLDVEALVDKALAAMEVRRVGI
ncbi:tRNA uracil 4-sulfurtransferase ThiI [Oceanithermus sp.]